MDDEKLDYCKEMIAKAEKLGKKLLLPVDTTIAAEFPNPIDAEIEVSVVDSKNSREAPPPVEMWLILSAKRQ